MSPYRAAAPQGGEPEPPNDGIARGHIERDVIDCPYCQAEAQTQSRWSGTPASVDPAVARPLALAVAGLVVFVHMTMWICS